MKKSIVTLLLSLLIIGSLGYGLFHISKSRTFQFFGGITARVETTEKVVALTFDDAPTAFSDSVLEILQEKNVPATFYVIGKNIETHPEEMQRIVDAGHEMGNHSYSHERFLLKSPSFIAEEIQKTNTLIKNTGYSGEITFRPPYGKKLLALPWYLKQQGIQSIMCDVEPDTYVSGDAEAILKYTLDHTRPGSIILLHPFCETECAAGREALPHIIDNLHAQGFRFVTVSDLLKYKI